MLGVGSHRAPSSESHVWHGCLHDNAFWRLGSGPMSKVGSSRKLDPTLTTIPANNLHKIIKTRWWMVINHIIMRYLEAQKWGALPQCWDLLTRGHTWDLGPLVKRPLKSRLVGEFVMRTHKMDKVGTKGCFKVALLSSWNWKLTCCKVWWVPIISRYAKNSMLVL